METIIVSVKGIDTDDPKKTNSDHRFKVKFDILTAKCPGSVITPPASIETQYVNLYDESTTFVFDAVTDSATVELQAIEASLSCGSLNWSQTSQLNWVEQDSSNPRKFTILPVTNLVRVKKHILVIQIKSDEFSEA